MATANISAAPRPEWGVDVDQIRSVRDRIARFTVRTPTLQSSPLTDALGSDVALKLESLQPTGSFKVRGAAARLGALAPDELDRGVITASTGNHGRAVAYVADRLGAHATICLSEHVPDRKVAAFEELGCTLDIGGPSQDAAFERATAAADRADGPTLVHAFLDPLVIAGQGTCGLEIAEQRPETTLVVVPLSGGGLISGVAVAVRALLPGARVVGVSMDRGAAMYESIRAGRPVALDEVVTLADSLQGGIGTVNDLTFPIVSRLVDDIVLVSEREIADAMRFALLDHGLVLEGAGAVGIAALRSGRLQPSPDDVTVVVCSGSNAEPATIADLATGRSPTER